MKKYTLFNEFSNKRIYGEDLGDALLHCRNLALQGKTVDNKYVPGQNLTIKRVLAYENVHNCKRGDCSFERVVVELDDHTRISIDARPSDLDTFIT